MRRILNFMAVLLLVSSAQAAVVGEAGPFADGSVDGWSGISVMDGYGSLPAGEMVSTFDLYGSPSRADGSHHMQPLILMNDGATTSIFDVGPVVTPVAGDNLGNTWNSKVVPSDGNSYWAGFWQWNDGVNNTDGGVVPFADAGGSGMFQEDEDGTSYVPAIGDEVVSGHASGADGRAYQFNVTTTVVPEPTSMLLALLAVLGVTGIIRRK